MNLPNRVGLVDGNVRCRRALYLIGTAALAAQAAHSQTARGMSGHLRMTPPPNYLRNRHGRPFAPKLLEGAVTLAMLYANGYGVPRNYALAIRFACEVGSAGGSNETERLGRLEALRDGKLPAGVTFDLCDQHMSGAMSAYCQEDPCSIL
jgi:hypothetical protein